VQPYHGAQPYGDGAGEHEKHVKDGKGQVGVNRAVALYFFRWWVLLNACCCVCNVVGWV
jgi:hypothetical protein